MADLAVACPEGLQRLAGDEVEFLGGEESCGDAFDFFLRRHGFVVGFCGFVVKFRWY